MFACRDIGEGEELSFDYADAGQSGAPLRKASAGTVCTCGASTLVSKFVALHWSVED